MNEYNIFDYSDVVKKRGSMYFKEPELIIKKPKEGFYNKLVPATSTHKNYSIDKLDIFKKDKASNFLYPTRFNYADTDAISWKSHVTKDFEQYLPSNYGVGQIIRDRE